SVAFQVSALNEHVNSLPRDSAPHLSPEQRVTLANVAMIRLIDIDAICQADAEGRRPQLDSALSRVDADMASLSDILTRQYLSHAQPASQLANLRTEAAE